MIEDLERSVAELQAWKQRQEQAQAERLMLMNNGIIDVLVKNSATVTESLTVLRMAELSVSHGFLEARRSAAAMAEAAIKPAER